MKKELLVSGLLLCGLLIGCSSGEQNEPTGVGEITQEVVATDVPKVTEEPKITEEAKATTVPKATEAPKPTEAPIMQWTPVTSEWDGSTLTISGTWVDSITLNAELEKHGLSREELSKAVVTDEVQFIADAFSGCTSLSEVTLPKAMEFIDRNAFSGCTSLEKVVFPENLKSIGENAFMKSGLINVTLPEGLERIEEGAFSYCSELESISMPASVVYIGSKAFSNCYGLDGVVLPPNLQYLGSEAFSSCTGNITELPEFAYSIVGENEILFGGWVENAPHLDLITYQVPETLYGKTVVGIGDYAFLMFNNLEKINLPGSTRTFGKNAFGSCYKLKEINIPSSVTTIGELAFSACESLEEIVLPEGVTLLESYAFIDCKNLKSITLPASVTKIGSSVFDTGGDITVHCIKGSYSETYLKEKGIKYVVE